METKLAKMSTMQLEWSKLDKTLQIPPPSEFICVTVSRHRSSERIKLSIVTHSSSAGVLETEALLAMVHRDKFASHIQKDEAQRR